MEAKAESSARSFTEGEGFGVRIRLPGGNLNLIWDEITTEEFLARKRGIFHGG